MAVFRAHQSAIECLAFTVDEQSLATSSGKDIVVHRYDSTLDSSPLLRYLICIKLQMTDGLSF